MRTTVYTKWAKRRFWNRPDHRLGNIYQSLQHMKEFYADDVTYGLRDTQMNRIVWHRRWVGCMPGERRNVSQVDRLRAIRSQALPMTYLLKQILKGKRK